MAAAFGDDYDDILVNRNREGLDSDLRKRKRGVDTKDGDRRVRTAGEEEKERALEALARDNAVGEDFDLHSLRKLILGFERKVSANQEARIKFADQPTKFVDSEIKLHESLQEMHVISTNPSLYEEVCACGVLTTILGLFAHDNSDIAAEAINLLEDLIDVETVEGSGGEDDAKALLEHLLGEQMPLRLLQAVQRLNEAEKEEADAVHHALGVVENMLELRPETSAALLEDTEWLPWLLQRVRVPLFDANKLYASELLAIVFQSSEQARKRVAAFDAINIALEVLAPYKRKDPSTPDEVEFMENLFNVLCAIVMETENRELFLKAEGVDLMLLMIKEHHRSRVGALKALSFVLSGVAGAPACAVFIERLGLKTIFSTFMVTPTSKLKKMGYSALEFEEHVLSILGALLRNCSEAHRARVLGKFVENNFEKIDRLVELHVEYSTRLREQEPRFEQSRVDLRADGYEDEEIDEELYGRRLESGLFTLQTIDLLAAEACSGCGQAVHEHLSRALKLRGRTLAELASVVQEFAKNVAPDEHNGDAYQKHLQSIVQSLSE